MEQTFGHRPKVGELWFRDNTCRKVRGVDPSERFVVLASLSLGNRKINHLDCLPDGYQVVAMSAFLYRWRRLLPPFTSTSPP